jgi:hypothetical protein
MLHWRDNCAIDTIEQTPTPGSWLTTKYNTVLIRAIDNFANYTDILGSVELIDTIPPELIGVDSTLITKVYETINSLYDAADRVVARQEMYFDNTFPYDILRVSYVDSLGVTNYITGIPDTIRPTNLYPNKIMLTWTSPGHALTHEGGRWITFQEPGDTLIVQ